MMTKREGEGTLRKESEIAREDIGAKVGIGSQSITNRETES